MKWESGHIKFINDLENNSGGESESLVKAMCEWRIVTRRSVDTHKNKLSLVKADGPCFNVVGFLKEEDKDVFWKWKEDINSTQAFERTMAIWKNF